MTRINTAEMLQATATLQELTVETAEPTLQELKALRQKGLQALSDITGVSMALFLECEEQGMGSEAHERLHYSMYLNLTETYGVHLGAFTYCGLTNNQGNEKEVLEMMETRVAAQGLRK